MIFAGVEYFERINGHVEMHSLPSSLEKFW